MSRLTLRKIFSLALAAALLFTGVFPALGQGTEHPAPARGMLLVANETIRDPRFRHSVILLVQNSNAGVAGVIVNAPTGYALADLAERIPSEVAKEPVFYGGPLQGELLLTVLQTTAPPSQGEKLGKGLYLINLEQLAARRRSGTADTVRICSGYAGWATGQLAAEIERGDWRVLPSPPDLLSTPPDGLWDKLTPQNREIWI